MGKSFLKNTFSVFFDKEIFTAIIAGLTIIGFISWAHVHKSIQKDVNHRLEYEAETVTSALANSLNNYGSSLAYTRLYLDAHAGYQPDKKRFRAFVENLQAQSTTYNLLDLNFSTRAELRKLVSRLPNSHKNDILQSLTAASITLTYPLTQKARLNADDFSLVLTMPFFGQKQTPATEKERAAKAQGLIYIPVSFKDLFTHVLGEANEAKEHVNFSLIFIDPASNKETLAYTRFPGREGDSSLQKVHEVEMYGKRWKISVIALPDFLSLSDRYLGHVVALATALVVGLLLSFFKQFENAILHETKEKALLEESHRMKSAFLANMSHEIRTPLNAITGYSEILSRTDNPLERQILIENIQKNSSHLTGIIDNILDISNIEFGKIFISTHRISVRSLFEDVLLTMSNRAVTKGIEFKIKTEGLMPEYVQTAESRVKQIMTNLLGNAVKFTEEGSVSLTFSAQNTANGQKFLIVSVIDTGIGISKHDQADLFQSFSQADASSTRRFGGVGLGLVVSKRMAQQFGGDVTLIDSRLGRGSTFELKIPCGDIAGVEWVTGLMDDVIQPKTLAQLQDYNQLTGKKILIVEDSEDNQDIFQFFLKSVGAITDVVDNGVSAIRKVRENDYDLILMDIQLPQMDGLEATRRLRVEGFTNPIIALTAHSSSEEKASSLESGCIGLITKPVSQDTLVQQILALMNDSTKDITTRNVALKPKENYDRDYASSRRSPPKIS
ncbi:MAG: response regulator [Pseudobdellovibrio sp.]|nr:response regulator [Pseudobdellovibrio sp.]